MVLLFGQNHLIGLARKSCMVVSAILVSVVACTYMQFCRLNRKVISHGLFPHNQLKRMPNLNDFSFVCKQICNRISLRADVPLEKASRRTDYNRIEVLRIEWRHVRSRQRAWIRVICSFPIKLLPSWEEVGVEGLIDSLTRWRHIRARYAQPPRSPTKFDPYAYANFISIGSSFNKSFTENQQKYMYKHVLLFAILHWRYLSRFLLFLLLINTNIFPPKINILRLLHCEHVWTCVNMYEHMVNMCE